MKICIINNLYKPYSIGGAEQVVELIGDGLARDGHGVFVITTKPIFWNRKSEIGNRDIYYMSSFQFIFRKFPKFLRLFWHVIEMFDIGSYFKIRKILKKERPDIVMTHNLVGIGFLIPKLIHSLKIKHTHTLHDIQLLHPSGLMIYGREKVIDSRIAKIYQLICKTLFSEINTIISPSKWLIDEHVKRGYFNNSRQLIIPNPVKLPTDNLGSGIKDREIFRLLYVGQIEEHKGIYFLINAFNKLCKNSGRNYELMLAGGGSILNKCKKKIREQKLNNIKFIGKIDNYKVIKLMSGSNCLVIPSLCYENSPTVIYEAIGAGLPVIASRIGGITELVHKFGGILFTPNNADEFIRKINWAQKNPAFLQTIARRGVKKISQFKISAYSAKILNI